MAKKTTFDIECVQSGMLLMWDGKEMIWKNLFIAGIERKRFQRKEKLEKINNKNDREN